MRRCIILTLGFLIWLNSSANTAIGLPINPITKEIDYSNWDWQNINSEQWPVYRDANKGWEGIDSPFSRSIQKNELMYNIYNTYDPITGTLGDWTVEKGWRLIYVNLKGQNPHFILYNVYSAILRAFFFLEKENGGDFTHYAFTLEPVNSSKSKLKQFSYGSDALIAVNGEEEDISVTVFSKGSAGQWLAFETPILFDNKIKDFDADYRFDFLGCDKYDLKFKMTGEAVPAGGSSAFAHSTSISPGSTFNAKEMAAKIHTPIKTLNEWSETIFKEAKSINESKNKHIPSVVKKLGKSLDNVSGLAKIASTLSGISSGIEILAGIFDFFSGGSNASTSPVSYKISLEGSGSVFISKSIRSNTLKVPASLTSDLWRDSWQYNGAMGLFSLEETPILTQYSLLGSIINQDDCNAEPKTKMSSSLDDLETSPESELRGSAKNKYKIDKLYKLTNDIKLNKKAGVEIVSVKAAILVTEYNSTNIMERCHYIKKDGGDRRSNFVDLFLSKGYAVVHKFEMSQEVPENADAHTKRNIDGVYEYGTRYVSPEELRDMAIPQNKVYIRDKNWVEERSDLSLGIIVRYRYKDDPTDQLRTYKGKYKCKIKDESSTRYTNGLVKTNGIYYENNPYENAIANLPAYYEEMVINSKSRINARYPVIILAPGFISEVGFTAKSTNRKTDSPYQFVIESFAFGNDNTGIPRISNSTRTMLAENVEENVTSVEQDVMLENRTISLYPNPTDGIINFKCTDVDTQYGIKIYNMSGALVYSNDNLINGDVIDLTNQTKGVYIARILVDGEIKTDKIVIK